MERVIVFFLFLAFVLGSKVADFPDGTNIQIWTCDTPERQQWVIHPDDLTIRLKSDDKCVDISNYGTSDGSNVWLFSCHTQDKDPAHQNQEWRYDATKKTFVSTLSGKCLDVNAYGTSPGTNVQIWDCTGNANQEWYINQTDSTIRGVASGLCLDAGSSYPPPCSQQPEINYPYCNYNLPIADRVKDLVSRIPLNEKIGLFENGASPVPSQRLPGYQWWSEALHGVAGSPGVSFSGATPFATSFPQIIGMGASFNMDLVHRMGVAIGTEGRAMNNLGNAGLTFWAPNINIIRDPRWGRGQETPGEDPFLTSSYVVNFVTGLQNDPMDPNHLKVSSCCKHYAAYDLENWHGMDRYHFNAICTEQDLADTYFPAFHSCVQQGKASGVMCSYNAVNGVPSCASQDLLNNRLRAQWGFYGYITSDCGAVDCVYNAHHYSKTPEDTCKDVLSAGMDIDCGSFLPSNLNSALSKGIVTQQNVDNALINLFTVQMRLGLFDPVSKQPFKSLNASSVNSPAHQALALEASRQSIVLLKNTNNALPLDKSKVKTIAVIGPNAAATSTMQGNYYGNAPYLISPTSGLSKYATVKYVKGCDIASSDTSGFAAACSAAQTSDATVIVIGLDQSQESEGNDRTILALPGVQNQLVSHVASCSKNPVTVVVMTGGPVDISAQRDAQNVGSILWVGYPGQSGGQAIAEVIFGDYNPGGRLPYTVYPADYINQVSMFDMGMRPNASNGNPGRTYRFYTGPTVYEFGSGLSYTNFTYTYSSSSLDSIPASKIQSTFEKDNNSPFSTVTLGDITVTVTNNGPRDGDAVVLGFAIPPTPGKNGQPLKVLVGFTRISLKVGQKQAVTFPTTAWALSTVNELAERVALPGVWTLQIETVSHSINVY
eukprot:TRINITY_DN661_c0_g1_i1.p1 TRINITY_DN661_c0_g1~~TRINITY_DN661_c0_g1_i1.p1  ORF type:complete len:885 (-),score=214.53 TRINITY_DN661_c0_g1_i1:67-2721(-)